jgi:hypothetical protein
MLRAFDSGTLRHAARNYFSEFRIRGRSARKGVVMICSACNNALTPGALFCTHCGARVVAAPPAYSFPTSALDRVARHLQGLAVLWFVYAGVRLLTGLTGVFFLHGFLQHGFPFGDADFNSNPWMMGWAHTLWPTALVSLLVSVACSTLVGFALMTRQPWGRIFAIVFAVLALIHLPFGTALGIYTLWVLGPRLSGDAYTTISART